ncbi:MAG TPA: TAXI family TRAP transporter solute-binding subunit [Xanthobacteraceae bacterium]|nr:TAXI family TRAP transporter solute-binding subunit [Xanthobacteraceae bacterium]
MRAFFRVFAIVLAGLAVTLAIAHFAWRAHEFKVAIPAADAVDHRVFNLAAETLRNQRAPVRIEVVTVENAKAALDALEAGKVKLAVVRSDAAMQGKAHTVLIMRREAAVLIAAKTGKLQKVTDLPNAMIGVTRDGPLDAGLLQPVLDYYGLAREKSKYMAVPPDEVAAALRQKKIDAVIVVGAVFSKQVSDVVSDAARGVKGAINFIDIEEADAIAKRIPALESIEVEQGAFGGRPPRPAESFNTLGYSIRLVGTPKVQSDDMAELVRQLYLIRQNLNAAIPGAGLMEAPDLDEATSYLIHPGVRAYVNGEQRNFFDRYSDYIYLVMFLGSGLGSVVVATLGWVRGNGNPQAMPVARVEAMLDAVRDATSREELDATEREADAVFRSVFSAGAAGRLPEAGIASFSMAMTELRARIAARRAALTA